MAKLLKLRRGTTSQHGSFTGAEGEVTIDTTKDTAVVHDGSTAGGRALAREDLTNVSSSTIAGRLSNDSITPSKIGSGTLPSDVTVASANLVDGTIVNADINASAAIAGTKISPDFGSQNISTTGTLGCGAITSTGNLTVSSTGPQVLFTDTNNNPDYGIWNNDGTFRFLDTNANATRFEIQSGGLTKANNNFQVVGNITVSGTVDGRDVASDGSKLDGIESGATADQTASDIKTLLQSSKLTNAEIADNTVGADQLAHTSVTAGSYGSATAIPAITVDAQGRITAASTNTVNTTTNLGTSTATGSVTVTSSTGNNATISEATSSAAGVMSTAHHDKLDGIAAGATNVTNNNQLTNGAGYITAAAVFPSGTKMIFQQTSAPTGWTKITSNVDNRALRVVSGTAGSGGNQEFGTIFASRNITANAGNTTQGGNISVANATQGGNISVANTTAGGNVTISSVSTSGNVNSHTLSTNEMPSHSHQTYRTGSNNNFGGEPVAVGANTGQGGNRIGPYYSATVYNWPLSQGGGGGHSHGFTGSSHSHNGTLSGTAHNHNATFSGSAHSHNATFSGSAHNHSISVSNLDMQVRFLDVIIASKD